jgi:phage regulator Rha-like protein
MANKLARLEKLIYEIRGQAVMLDSDLAGLYQVETRVLNQAVKRNINRFPKDFMFQLTKQERETLISQFVISSLNENEHGGRRKLPYAFTEAGVAMLSSVLKSDRAIETNVQIIRAFIKMRHYFVEQSNLGIQISDLRKVLNLYMEKNDKRIDEIMKVLSSLLMKQGSQNKEKPKVIGFKID